MPSFESNTRRIVARLERDGWQKEAGGRHDFKHSNRPGELIVVPRHRTLD